MTTIMEACVGSDGTVRRIQITPYGIAIGGEMAESEPGAMRAEIRGVVFDWSAMAPGSFRNEWR